MEGSCVYHLYPSKSSLGLFRCSLLLVTVHTLALQIRTLTRILRTFRLEAVLLLATYKPGVDCRHLGIVRTISVCDNIATITYSRFADGFQVPCN
ncbi:hypothetical protein MPTK1_7g18920 [Marchantia polymorpha subsp. ruderalis]|uniref:Uncharacterized protein n=2 Tax=Marchantia polymorpha TaxID=3197 RepID=A0AAF6C192_MARPO|nr:hypothetical protein MARPO_0067s0086 [Marchantia polymorpha]BBN18026.1 hypothetical protein Mp_7g18920 [Marchantia polymorpha subsp. ruderalis]|eukprot:PTQ36010.1 hypothetical protein MARPO_0067s0086 [Marchantia polymorpha]